MKQVIKEDNFSQILNAISDMVLVKGPKSKLLWANKAFCDYYGMSVTELEGIIDAPFSEPDYTQKFVKDDAHVFSTGKALDIPEEPANRYDGAVRLFHTVKTPIFDANKNVIMTVGVSRDITERREVEEHLRIERERNIASAKMASLGEMAGGVAHEINTPLTSLIMLAGQCEEILSMDQPDVLILKKNVDRIEKTARKIAKIVAGLRAFSRDGSNDPKLPVRVIDLIEDTLSFSREKLNSLGIELHISVQSDVSIVCRATEISQILLNLLNNSQDAIVDSKSEKWIRIETKLSGSEVEISVTDSGHGISKDLEEKIFKPFFTTKETNKGTGLGLSISKRIIESHNGSIFVDFTCPNTRFVIKLPFA